MNVAEFFQSLWNRFSKSFLEEDRWELYLQGLGNTLIIALIAAIIGIVIGFTLAMVNYVNKKTGKLKPLAAISKIYITIIRGTPVVLQLMIMYFVILVSWDSGIMIGAITFGLNSGAYVAEIIRGGIMSIDKGQMEAGRSLGFNYIETMRYIIIPQALKNVLPSLANEFIALLKETSVAGYVAVVDLTRAGNIIRGKTFSAFMPLFAVALIYLAMVMILTYFVGVLERRLRNSER